MRTRRSWLLGLGGTAAALGGAALWAGGVPGLGGSTGPAFPPRGGSHRYSLSADPAAPPQPVNRRVLGSNVQWVDNGDEVLDPEGRFRADMLALIAQMAPTGLRFPGGLQSDTYRWERAMGPLAQRGNNEHAHNRVQQPSRMGTLEFLELCEITGARPLITVNLITGDAAEAARWVRAVNVDGLTSRRSGRRLPPVTDWELGNEPYLKPDERPDLVTAPAEFARRAEGFARAMRAVDPTIRLGLPVGPDRRNGFQAIGFPGYTREVLGRLGTSVDWLAVHMAYMPFAWGKLPKPAELYWGAMASAASVAADLRSFAREVATLRPGLPALPMAITEYNALFTLGKGDTDNWITTPAAALYLADLMRVLAVGGDGPAISMAHHWSLSGNWRFGAIHSDGYARPGQQVMSLVGEALRGQARPLRVEVGTVATTSVGLAVAQPALPLVEALLCSEGPDLRLLLIHKDPVREAVGRLDLAAFGPFVSARLSRLEAPDLLTTADTHGLMRRVDAAYTLPAAGEPLTLTLPPGSVSLLHLQRRGAA